MCDGSLPEIGDMRGLGDAELIAAVAGWARAESAAAARKMAAMAEMFRRRTGLDKPVDRNNWFVDPEASAVSEIAAAQHITEALAMFQTHRAVALNDRLPQVAALFAKGLINDLLVRAVVDRTSLIKDPALMAAVDAELAAQITRWGALSAAKTKAAIDAIVEKHDPGARKRVKDSGKERDVQFGFISDPAGFMTLYARMYAADGNAFEQRVLDMARRLCPDDPRSGEDRLNDALAAVGAGRVLRCECGNADCPGATGDKPAKDVVVHLIASEDTLNEARRKAQQARTPQPETDGESVDEPEIVAEAAEPAAEGQDATAPHTTEGDADESVRDAGEPARPQKPECPAPAFVFGAGIANSALLAAFLDRATIRTVTHPGDAPPEPQYRPSAALSEFIRCRDLTCRFPHCDVPATRCDIDHTIPWPAGPTCGSNLKCLCRKHHLLKTFWTGKTGWRDEQFADGTVVWTSPSGDTYTTHPGSAQFFPTLAEPTAEAPVRENPQATENRGLKMPKRRRTRAQNRARYIDEQRKLNDDFVAERNRPPPF